MSSFAATAETTEDTTAMITATTITNNPPANKINIIPSPLHARKTMRLLYPFLKDCTTENARGSFFYFSSFFCRPS